MSNHDSNDDERGEWSPRSTGNASDHNIPVRHLTPKHNGIIGLEESKKNDNQFAYAYDFSGF